MRYLVKGGLVVDPALGPEGRRDILIEDGKVAAVGEDLAATGEARGSRKASHDGHSGGDDLKVIDATGKVVVPGLIDMHVHLREPGREDEETIHSGTRAAARGGFTGVVAMANTSPVADNGAVVDFVREKARREGLVNVYPVGAVTKGQKGEELAEIGELAGAGAIALSDDGHPIANAGLMRRALEYAGPFNLPVIVHAEDKDLAGDGVMHEGFVSLKLGLKGIPAATEEVMIARDLLLAEMTGGRLHIAHVSTAGAVELIRQAKRRGVRVTAEATPHHFTLTDEAVFGYNTNARVSPPLRAAEDVAAVRAGLADGTIDVIATDHAPHTREEKAVEFDLAPPGMVGLETAVALVLTELVARGVLSLREAVAKLTANPAKILGLAAGTLQVGVLADLTILDLEREWVVDTRAFVSRSRNSPFEGRRLRGMPVLTMVGGKVVARDGRIVADGEEKMAEDGSAAGRGVVAGWAANG
ncbi:MAG: dihydroorotase [Firmicutes bacterium]|nr:dihydroorotase [Bacillota bacterium]